MTSKSKLATNWICPLLAGTLVCSGTLLAQTAEKPKRNLLFIGQAKGFFDEIYQIKDFSRQNVRVLLSLDAEKIDLSRKGVKRADKDFAVVWAKNYGKGRVLYNGLGHVRAVWERPDVQKMWLEMVQWSMGLIPGDATPCSKPEKLTTTANGR